MAQLFRERQVLLLATMIAALLVLQMVEEMLGIIMKLNLKMTAGKNIGLIMNGRTRILE